MNDTGSMRIGTQRQLIERQRFFIAGAVVFAAVVPALVRFLIFPDALSDTPALHSVLANLLAIGTSVWMRLSIGQYPGNRSASLLVPTILVAHAINAMIFLFTRVNYDRLLLLLGLVGHLVWALLLELSIRRHSRLRIGMIPGGSVEQLREIDWVEWSPIPEPRLDLTSGCDALVADFSVDLTAPWEAFLADAALEGRVIFQVKQLAESLTGKVAIDHLSENSFGTLVPSRGYYYLKEAGDFLFALVVLPVVIVPMLLVGLAIRLDSRGPALFRQRRVGRAGRPIIIYKFRTMRLLDEAADTRAAAMTGAADDRITRVGAVLRQYRIDELPQIINILKGQMSWIGPRPEAEVLSSWYTGEIPFYRYRHVVKPGISGWAQVTQGHVAEVDQIIEKLQYDFFYIKYFSPWLDLLIVMKTMRTMLSGFGAR